MVIATANSVSKWNANEARPWIASFLFLLLGAFSVGGYAQELAQTMRVNSLLDRPLRAYSVDGDVFLQRDLTDYLNVTVGPDIESSDVDTDSEAYQSRVILKAYFMRPHPSVSTISSYFDRAAAEFEVPAPLLKIIGQVESNWTQVGPSIDQGWGVMHLVQNHYCNTLADAARRLGTSEQLLKDDAFQNVRGAAALIADYAGEDRKQFNKLADWFPALARFSGLSTPALRERQAENYLTMLDTGVTTQTVWGESIRIERVETGYVGTESDGASTASHRVAPMSSDYSPALTNWATSCNYGAGRNHSIDTWVNHWIASGTYLGTISWFQTCPGSGPGQRGYIPGTNTLYGASSAHFVIKNSNGEITQMVDVADSAYHCGASGYPYNNGRSIGVEHEATASNPGMWNSTAMLNASATMARYFRNKYGFPTTQNASPGICGHSDMPGTSTSCPGPLPWATWMSYFNATGSPAIRVTSPNGGETWSIGSPHTVTWTSSGLNSSGQLYILLSQDGGQTEYPTPIAVLAPSVTSYSWMPVSAQATSSGRVFVGNYVNGSYEADDWSDQNFTVGSTGPSNDNCSNATQLTSSTSCNFTSGTILNATASGLPKPSCDGFSSPNMFDVWYRFTAASPNETITVDPSGSIGDPVVSVYNSCNGTAIGCMDNVGGGGTETLSLTGLTVGNIYDVRVYDYGGVEPTGIDAEFSICVTHTATPNYTLTVSGSSTGQGIVTGNAINCTVNSGVTSGTCSVSLPSGTGVTLTPTPTGGSTFNGWGGACGGFGSCSFTMSGITSVTASFTAPVPKYTLSVNGSGTGQGTVTGNGLNCTINAGIVSGTCSVNLSLGTGVSLTASPTGSSTFGGWTGACAGLGGCNFTISSNANVTTSFTAVACSVGTPAITAPASVTANSTLNSASGTATAAVSYVWSISNGSITSSVTTQTISFTAGSSGSVTLNVVATGSGGCTSQSQKVIPITTSSARLRRSDFDANNISDIFWRNTSTGDDSLWYVSANGFLGGATMPSLGSGYSVAGIGDFNHDGKADILWRNLSTGEMFIWFMNGGTRIGTLLLPTIAPAVAIVGVGDFNGDGYADIFWRNTLTGDDSVWYITTAGFIGGVTLGTIPDQNLKILSVADFNNDGRADILWRNLATGDAYIWLCDLKGQIVGGSYLGAIPLSVTLVGTGDFNNDGTFDLLWRNTQTGNVSVWFIHNGSFIGGGFNFGDVALTGVNIVGVGDFNGDGTYDLLWRNELTGDDSIWFITSSGFTGGLTLPNIVGSALKIVSPSPR
jgi:hypothetical protein